MAELTELGKNACAAKYILQKLTTEEKNKGTGHCGKLSV